jgi:hypothetical protein
MNASQFKIKSVRNNSTSTEITQLVDLLLSPRDNKNILSPRSKNEVETVVTSPRKEKRQSFSFFKKRSTSLKPLNLEATNQNSKLREPESPRKISFIFSPRKLFTRKSKELQFSSQKEIEICSQVEPSIELKFENVPNLEMQEVLDHLGYRNHFKTHLKKEWSSENIIFYEEIEEYKKLDFEERKTKANGIISQFFNPLSIYEINTSNILKQQVKENLEFASIDLFDDIICDLMTNMLSDSFKRFKKTPMYCKMFQ